MKKHLVRVAILVAVSFAAFVGAWVATYPDKGDPKNIKYILWKAGIYKLDLDLATEVMVGDPGREKLVIGKTEAQLKKRFGYLLTPDEASYYLQGCTSDPPRYKADPPYGPSPWKDKKRLFIRRSPWMVVFDGDKARELWLIKGC